MRSSCLQRTRCTRDIRHTLEVLRNCSIFGVTHALGVGRRDTSCCQGSGKALGKPGIPSTNVSAKLTRWHGGKALYSTSINPFGLVSSAVVTVLSRVIAKVEVERPPSNIRFKCTSVMFLPGQESESEIQEGHGDPFDGPSTVPSVHWRVDKQ